MSNPSAPPKDTHTGNVIFGSLYQGVLTHLFQGVSNRLELPSLPFLLGRTEKISGNNSMMIFEWIMRKGFSPLGSINSKVNLLLLPLLRVKLGMELSWYMNSFFS